MHTGLVGDGICIQGKQEVEHAYMLTDWGWYRGWGCRVNILNRLIRCSLSFLEKSLELKHG